MSVDTPGSDAAPQTQPPGSAQRILLVSTPDLEKAGDSRALLLATELARPGTEVRVLPVAESGVAASDNDTSGRALREALLDWRPDLLLAPSPREPDSGRRAAFFALHRLVAPLRDDGSEGDDLIGVVRQLDLLLFERSPVEFGERQAALDLRLRSRAGWVRQMGGDPQVERVDTGPLVSIVVRTRNRPELLAQALASLDRSSYRRIEVVLVNDGGEPPELPNELSLTVVRVDLPAQRGRAAAANAGLDRATGDFVGFLDDDDLVEPEHVETLVELTSTSGEGVVYTDAAVGVYERSGDAWQEVERRLPYSRDFDADLLALDNYIPFHTVLVERDLAREAGPLDESLDVLEDWEWLLRLARRTTFRHLAQVTCEYRHFRGTTHHALAGDRARDRGEFLAAKARVLERQELTRDAARLAVGIDRWRSESVAAREETDSLRRENRLERRTRAEMEDLAHRSRGEVEALRGHLRLLEDQISDALEDSAALRREVEGRDQELQRLYDDEARLRATLEEQDAHLRRVYAEIERLNALLVVQGSRLREVESFWAWRLRRWLGRLLR